MAIAAYLVVNISLEDGEGPPGFVYGIFFSLFIFFNSFAINMVLQYRQVGRWRDYLFGESFYILLPTLQSSPSHSWKRAFAQDVRKMAWFWIRSPAAARPQSSRSAWVAGTSGSTVLANTARWRVNVYQKRRRHANP